MPNWAEMHELSVTLKATHAEVDYTSKSPKWEKCGNCKNFIPHNNDSRCRTVLSPIVAPGWCERYEPN
jgi:hypothetical protein